MRSATGGRSEVSRTISAARSASANTVAAVFVDGTTGMTDASATRRIRESVHPQLVIDNGERRVTHRASTPPGGCTNQSSVRTKARRASSLIGARTGQKLPQPAIGSVRSPFRFLGRYARPSIIVQHVSVVAEVIGVDERAARANLTNRTVPRLNGCTMHTAIDETVDRCNLSPTNLRNAAESAEVICRSGASPAPLRIKPGDLAVIAGCRVGTGRARTNRDHRPRRGPADSCLRRADPPRTPIPTSPR